MIVIANVSDIKIKDNFQLSGWNKKVKGIIENNITNIDNINCIFTLNSSSKCFILDSPFYQSLIKPSLNQFNFQMDRD